jgi:hypothetical protein
MTSDADAGSDEELRRELTSACAAVRRQIDLQQSVRYARVGGTRGDDIAIDRLNRTLAQLEEALANLGKSDA